MDLGRNVAVDNLVRDGELIYHSSTSIRLLISPLINPTDHKNAQTYSDRDKDLMGAVLKWGE